MASFGFGNYSGAPSSLRIAPRRQRGTLMMTAPSLYTAGFVQGSVWTWINTIPIPAPFFAVRFLYANASTVSTYQIGGIAFRASDSPNDYANPTGTATWQYATYANGGAIETGTDTDLPRDAATTLAGATGFPVTVPATAAYALTGATTVPKLVATDWNYCSCLDPIGGGNAYYLSVRTLGPAQTWYGCIQTPSTGWTGVSAVNRGYDWAVKVKSGDFVTTAGVVAAPGSATLNPIFAVQFLTLKGVINVLTSGDSHFAGDSTSQNMATFLNTACLDLTTELGIPVCPVNAAWGGTPSNVFWPTANFVRDFARPSIEIMPGWTANDGLSTRAASDRYIGRVIAGVERARLGGAVPIIMGPIPRTTGLTGAALTEWQYIRTRLNSLATGVAVIDAAALIGTPATGAYVGGNSTDGVHPNDTGHAVLATALKPVIRTLIGRNMGVAA